MTTRETPPHAASFAEAQAGGEFGQERSPQTLPWSGSCAQRAGDGVGMVVCGGFDRPTGHQTTV